MYTYKQGDKLYKELEEINKDLRAGNIEVKIAAELNNNCGKRIQVARNQIVWYQLTNRIGIKSLDDDERILEVKGNRIKNSRKTGM